MKEVWKPILIEDIHPHYAVSSYGRVYDLNKNKYLKCPYEGGGYKTVSMRIENYTQPRKTFTIHRLVALIFIDNPDKLPRVGHKDHNRENNKMENLYWATAKQIIERLPRSNISGNRIRKRNQLVAGVGVNDVDYNVRKWEVINGVQKIVWSCPFYIRWAEMLKRCYSDLLQKKFPTYIGCSVVEEWHRFSTFKAWMETHDWEGKHLDKDLLLKGNKIYGPNTCIFVDAKVNLFITEKSTNAGGWPVGVTFRKSSGKYMAYCWSVETRKSTYLGSFTTPEDAHKKWLDFKLQQAYDLANQQTDERVAKALIDRYKNYAFS